MNWWKLPLRTLLAAIILSWPLCWSAPAAIAACPTGGSGESPSCSTNYRIDESLLGGSGDIEADSASYSIAPGDKDAGATLGDNFAGSSSSSSYQLNSGFNTTSAPGLTFCVGTSGTGCADMTGSTVSLGTLSSTVATTATAKFSVKNYTSYGYAITIIGNPPTNSGHDLTNLATQTASASGSEQFGINLRANTSPATVGADPSPVPSSTFSLSDPAVVVDANYRTANQYRYNSGDRIALAPQSSGETTYTISFLANISTTTPGGQYSGNLTLVATGTY